MRNLNGQQYRPELLTGIVLTCLLTACNGSVRVKPVMPAELELQTIAGVLERYDEALWFRPCYERLWWPVQDYTDTGELSALYNRLNSTAQGGLYVEVDGAIDPEQDNQLLVETLSVAGGTDDTCAYRINDLQFRAANSSPYWVADINDDAVQVKSVNPLGRYSFLVASEQDEQGLIYRETTAVPQPFSIRLTEQRCVDSHNGTILAYQATMQLFGHSYRGCARKGHHTEDQLEGYYWYADAEADQVVLNLSPDQRVQLVRKDRKGRVVSERGSWQFLSSGKLILSMKKSSGKEFVLLFRRQENGELQLQSNEFSWAPAQAAFVQWRPSGLPGGRQLPVAGDDLAEPLPDDSDVIIMPDFNPVPAEPDGDQLTPITVTECVAGQVDQAC